MTIDSRIPDTAEIQAIEAQASMLMKRGMRLMGDTGSDTIREALDWFDRALALRRQLPIETAPILRYRLAACWLNRADALMRLNDATHLSLAVEACDEALVLLRELPLADDPRFPRRFAIAHHNRGRALHAQGATHLSAAIAAFMAAIAILEGDEGAGIDDRDYLLAAAWMNVANARVSDTRADSDALIRAAALRAIGLVANLEFAHADAADVGLQARHVLCHMIARHLSEENTASSMMSDDVHEATDMADDGLRLVRHWEQKGVSRFRSVAIDLFRFGGRVYEIYQPQFLAEFLVENIDPERSSDALSAEFQRAAPEIFERLRQTGGQ